MTRTSVSAGVLLFRRTSGAVEVFLAHPGGPFWAKRDLGAWTIPKGEVEAGEALLDGARRELLEETGIPADGAFLPLGAITQKAGKIVHAWALERDADPDAITSNTTRAEWPRGSGNWLTFPEIDRCAWFDLGAARDKINPAQAELLDRLLEILSSS